MYTTNLRKVGGSVMMAVPPALLDLLHLKAGAAVAMSVSEGRLVVEANSRPKYTLRELLAQCDPNAGFTAEDKEWLDSPQVGNELL